MKTLGSRIAHYREKAGLSQAALAKACGWKSQSRIGNYEKDAREPNLDDIAKIAHELKIAPAALLLPDESPSNISPAAQPSKSFRYPVVSWVAAGAWAEAVEPYPAGISDTYEFSEYDSKGPAFWLTVKGDSMTAPAGQSITEGTLILVDTEAEVAPGKLVVAKLPDSNEATFKKLVSDGGRLFLKPLNPSYPIEAVDENCRIVGVVVQALQKFY
ncbi:LexA repressor [Pseudomonas sp. 22 E 5]|nr:LexA repressor [Pseudomonas sp. 22 E 5]